MPGRAQTAAMVLGGLSGLIGVYHGYNEILQGTASTGGVFINAIGPPCQGSSCFPAMTVLPNFLDAGVISVLVSLVILGWSLVLARRPRGGVILAILSVVQLLVGGGFLPPALGIVAGAVAMRARHPRPIFSSTIAPPK